MYEKKRNAKLKHKQQEEEYDSLDEENPYQPNQARDSDQEDLE